LCVPLGEVVDIQPIGRGMTQAYFQCVRKPSIVIVQPKTCFERVMGELVVCFAGLVEHRWLMMQLLSLEFRVCRHPKYAKNNWKLNYTLESLMLELGRETLVMRITKNLSML